MANTTGKKYGGREKGTPNKTTKEIREAFDMLIRSNIGNFTLWLEQVAETDPAKALGIIQGMAEYVVPKLARTELVGDDKKPLNIEIKKTYDKE